MLHRLSRRCLSSSRRWASTASSPPLSRISPNTPPHEVARILRSQAVKRVMLVRGDLLGADLGGGLLASNTLFDGVAEALTSGSDFAAHEAVFVQVSEHSDSLLTASLHNTTRGAGAGGVRLWRYDSTVDALTDGLRLARGMGRKNALAGLWWGGGKGVISADPEVDWHKDMDVRVQTFREYGSFLSSLRGCYVSAEDVGAVPADMAEIFTRTRFITCIPEAVGGSGNPSIMTALGVVAGMEAALEHLAGGEAKDVLQGKRVAVQGLGNVARPMISRLLECGVASVVATDVSEAALAKAHEDFGEAIDAGVVQCSLVPRGDNSVLFDEDADIVSPCALGGTINPETIPHIKARLIVGAANNQLLNEPDDDELLKKAGITFTPDFVVNRMGIVNCCDEQYGSIPGNKDPAILSHLGRGETSIYTCVREILKFAQDSDSTPSVAARKLADDAQEKLHPIWPERPRQIVRALAENNWHLQQPHED